jgi:hypothetical protein
MAKRYQHVTDTVRASVATQVDGLIWAARSDHSAEQAVTVRRESLAAILPLVERGLLNRDDSELDVAELEAALTDLRTAIAGPEGTPNGGTK